MPKLNKEKWGKPKLIILTRGGSEERVLYACKSSGGIWGSASQTLWASCRYDSNGEYNCLDWCSAPTDS